MQVGGMLTRVEKAYLYLRQHSVLLKLSSVGSGVHKGKWLASKHSEGAPAYKKMDYAPLKPQQPNEQDARPDSRLQLDRTTETITILLHAKHSDNRQLSNELTHESV